MAMSDSQPAQPSKIDPVVAALLEGSRLHRSGQLRQADAAYERALGIDPRNADALHLRGVIACQMGQPSTGLDFIGRALAIRPNPQYHNSLGLALTASNDRDGAERAFAEALRLEPKYADAHINAGNLARRRGNIEAALGHYRQAVALAPGHAPAACLLGDLLTERGNPEEALPHLEKAARLMPNDASILVAFGTALAQLRRPAAEEVLNRALTMKPDEATALAALAGLRMEQNREAEAASLYERAVAAAPHKSEYRALLGQALTRTGRLDEARATLDAALAADPKSVAALVGLSQLALVNGDFAAERAHAEAALALDDSSFAALAQLAGIKGAPLSAAQWQRAEQATADPRLKPGERRQLHFALFRQRQSEREFDDAFRHLAAGNAMRGEGLRRKGRVYDPSQTEAQTDDLIQTFDKDFFARAAGPGSDSEVSILVVGMPRSGTTLVEQILASHSGVFGAGELRDLGLIASDLLATAATRAASGTSPTTTLASAPDLLGQGAGRYLARLRELAPGAGRVVDKMPGNFLRLGLVALLLPRTHIVHCRRHPMDTGLSCFMQSFSQDMPWAWDLASIGHYYRQYERVMEHWRQVLPLPIHDVVYETMVENTEQEARALVAHCGLEWEAACLDFHNTERPVQTASASQVRQPIYKGSVGRWRDYERHLEPLRRALDGLAT
jgi:tetratricopeptide (TPR) repeat protein